MYLLKAMLIFVLVKHRLLLTNIWKSDLFDKIKQKFLHTAAMSVLLYGRTTWNAWRKSYMATTHKKKFFKHIFSSKTKKKTKKKKFMLNYRVGWPAWTYIQQLCKDTGCSLENLPEAMNDREKWRERVRDIRAGSTTWWWWWQKIIFRSSHKYQAEK